MFEVGFVYNQDYRRYIVEKTDDLIHIQTNMHVIFIDSLIITPILLKACRVSCIEHSGLYIQNCRLFSPSITNEIALICTCKSLECLNSFTGNKYMS